jgi:hypothetical protein
MTILLLAALQLGPSPTLESEPPPVALPLLQARSGPVTFGVCLGVQGRLVLPFGSLEDGYVDVIGNVVFIEDHLDYNDLFDVGLGVTLEADILFRPPPPRIGGPPWEDTPAMGIFVAFERDWFAGESAEDEPDDWEITSVIVGFKAQGTIEGPFYGDVRVGLGYVSYPSLEADLRPTVGPGGRGELFAESGGLAMEGRMHFGARVGPLGFLFGFGGRFLDGPNNGDDVRLDPNAMWTLELELGAELNF